MRANQTIQIPSLITRREMLQLSCTGGVAYMLGNSSPENPLALSERLVAARDAVDHLVLGVADLDQGMALVEKATGVKAVIGGVHPGAGTRNALLSLDRKQYLEIIAPDPAQSQTVGRFGDLKQLTSPRLLAWAAVTKEINTVAERARASGYEIDGPRDGSRARPDGKLLKWRSMSVKNELSGVIPFFIEWGDGTVHPSEDSTKGCRLDALEMEHPEPDKVRELLKRLGIEARVSRGNSAQLRAVLATPKGRVVIDQRITVVSAKIRG
ncbi:MAG: VOC family protein [Acidobacteria bacterium]|nr:VOC family protein [Acidobacteriota bacterium]